MTGTAQRPPHLLISVRSEAEALVALEGEADIIDIKEPRTGALGAAPLETVCAIVKAAGGRRPVSATLGDIPLSKAAEAACVTAATGVDYVKTGAFPDDAGGANLSALAPLAALGVRLILVLFADLAPDFELVGRAAAAGFRGVMLDTAVKGRGGLRAHLSHADIAGFLAEARRHRLLAGLAGSLKAADIAPLSTLQPDILGFRGAACAGETREGTLDAGAVAALRRHIPRMTTGCPARDAGRGRLLAQEA